MHAFFKVLLQLSARLFEELDGLGFVEMLAALQADTGANLDEGRYGSMSLLSSQSAKLIFVTYNKYLLAFGNLFHE